MTNGDAPAPRRPHTNSKASKAGRWLAAGRRTAAALKAQATSELVGAPAGTPASTAGVAWATRPACAGGTPVADLHSPRSHPRPREAALASGAVAKVEQSPNVSARKAQRPDTAATAPQEARKLQPCAGGRSSEHSSAASLPHADTASDAVEHVEAPEPAGAAVGADVGPASLTHMEPPAADGAGQQAVSPRTRSTSQHLRKLNRPQLISLVLRLEEELASLSCSKLEAQTASAQAMAEARHQFESADQLCSELLVLEQRTAALLADAQESADLNAQRVRELELQLKAAAAESAGAAESAKAAAAAAAHQLEKESQRRLQLIEGVSTKRLRWLREHNFFRGCTQQVLDAITGISPDDTEPAQEPLQYVQTRSNTLPNHAYTAHFISGALKHMVCCNQSLTGLLESLRTTPDVLLNQPNPNDIPCAATFRAYLLLAVQAFKEEISEDLKRAAAVNVYYDGTKKDGRSWLFVGADFTLLTPGQEPEVRTFVFGMRLSDGGTGQALADFLHNLICKEWGVPTQKVVFVTLDSCAANVGERSGAVALWSQVPAADTSTAATAAVATAAAVAPDVAACAPAVAAAAGKAAAGKATKGKGKRAQHAEDAPPLALKFPVHCTNHILHNALEHAIKVAFGRSSTMARSGSNSDVIFFLERISNLFRTKWSVLYPIIKRVCGDTPFPKPPDPQLTRWDIFCQVARWFMARYNTVLTVIADWTKALGNKCPADQIKLFKQLTEPSMLIQTSILAEFATVYSTSAQLWAEDKGGFRAFEIHGFFTWSLAELTAAHLQPEEYFPETYRLAGALNISTEELTHLIQTFVAAYTEYLHKRCIFWWRPPYVFAQLGAKEGAQAAARRILKDAYDNGILRPTWTALGLLTAPDTLADVRKLAAGSTLQLGSALHTFLATYYAPLRVSNAVSESAMKVLKLPHIRQGQEPMVNAYASLKLGQPFEHYKLSDTHFYRARLEQARQQAAVEEDSGGAGAASKRQNSEEAARQFVERRQRAHFDCAPDLLAAVYATIAAATEEQPAADSASSSKSEKEEAVRAVLRQDPSLDAAVWAGRITIATMREWLLARKLPKLPTNCLWLKAADTVLAAAREALVEVEAVARHELEKGAQDWAARGIWQPEGMPRQYLAQLLAQDAAAAVEEEPE